MLQNSFDYSKMSYLGSRQRQNIASWRFCIVILAIVSSPGYCRSTANRFSSSRDTQSPASSLQRKTLGQEIGSPSELAWQAWLLVDNKNGAQSSLESSNILRRITPKSIFIAPEFIACSKGYSADGKGVCKPDPINIDENAQMQFNLMRLNAKFGNNRKKPAGATGPLQISIPLSLPSKSNPPEMPLLSPVQPQSRPQQPIHKDDQEVVDNDRLTIPIVISEQLPAELDKNKNEEAVTKIVYKVHNDTKKEQQEITTSHENTSIVNENTNPTDFVRLNSHNGQVVPVAEIIDDTSETTSGVVDYKIPINLRPALNRSDFIDRGRIDHSKAESSEKIYGDELSEDPSPTVILLSSTQSPFISSTPTETETPRKNNFKTEITSTDSFQTEKTTFETWNSSTIKLDSEQDENATDQLHEINTKSESDVIVQTVTPLNEQTPIDSSDSILKNTEKISTDDRSEDETVYFETPTESESEDPEDYDDTTGDQYESFGDSEHELLKPGEAGMMLSHKNQDFLKKNKKNMSTTPMHTEDLTSTTLVDTTTLPTFTLTTQESIETSDDTIKTEFTEYTKEDIITTQNTETPSTITTTSEGRTYDTTIFTTKTPRISNPATIIIRTNPTSLPTTSALDQDQTEFETTYSKEKLVTIPEVIFSTKESHDFTTAYDQKKPTTYPSKTEGTSHTLRDLEDVIPGTEVPLFPDYHRRNTPINRRHKPSVIVNDERVIFTDEDKVPFEFRDQLVASSKPLSMDFKSISSHSGDSPAYIRFPEQPERRSQEQSFVRFPSDEVNSIHNQDYKEHLSLSPFGASDEYNDDLSTSTKSSVFARQKSPTPNWRLPPPGIRMDRQEQQQMQQMNSDSVSQRQQKQKSMLMKFWSRVPLVRDSSLYPTTSHGSHNDPIGGQMEPQYRRRNSRFTIMSTMPPSSRTEDFPKELFSRDVDRLLNQRFGQPVIGDA